MLLLLKTIITTILVSFPSLFFFKVLCIYSRETEREAEAQAEGEAGSLPGPWCGTWSQDPRITTWAKGRCLTADPPRCPSLFQVLNFWYSPTLSLSLEKISNHRKKGREPVHQNITLSVHPLIHNHSQSLSRRGPILRTFWRWWIDGGIRYGVWEKEKSQRIRSTRSCSLLWMPIEQGEKKDVRLETQSMEQEETCTCKISFSLWGPWGATEELRAREGLPEQESDSHILQWKHNGAWAKGRRAGRYSRGGTPMSDMLACWWEFLGDKVEGGVQMKSLVPDVVTLVKTAYYQSTGPSSCASETQLLCAHLLGHQGGSAGWASDSWFWLRSWPQCHEFEPCIRLCTELGACLGFSLSLSLCPFSRSCWWFFFFLIF